jgi:AbiV family abortive infection protein
MGAKVSSATSFLEISQKECLEVYKDIINNSEMHFAAGQQLAKTKMYGVAVSHLVLGSEELVKAIILYLDGNGLKIRAVKGVSKFFRDHKLRHVVSASYSLIAYVWRPFMEAIEWYKDLIHNPERQKNPSELEQAALSGNQKKLESFFKEWVRSEKGRLFFRTLKNSVTFWGEADESKMRGFYVDYDNSLLLPKHVTLRDYNKALKVTMYFKEEVLNGISYFERQPLDDRKAMIKFLHKSGQFYYLVKMVTDPQSKKQRSQNEL